MILSICILFIMTGCTDSININSQKDGNVKVGNVHSPKKTLEQILCEKLKKDFDQVRISENGILLTKKYGKWGAYTNDGIGARRLFSCQYDSVSQTLLGGKILYGFWSDGLANIRIKEKSYNGEDYNLVKLKDWYPEVVSIKKHGNLVSVRFASGSSPATAVVALEGKSEHLVIKESGYYLEYPLSFETQTRYGYSSINHRFVFRKSDGRKGILNHDQKGDWSKDLGCTFDTCFYVQAFPGMCPFLITRLDGKEKIKSADGFDDNYSSHQPPPTLAYDSIVFRSTGFFYLYSNGSFSLYDPRFGRSGDSFCHEFSIRSGETAGRGKEHSLLDLRLSALELIYSKGHDSEWPSEMKMFTYESVSGEKGVVFVTWDWLDRSCKGETFILMEPDSIVPVKGRRGFTFHRSGEVAYIGVSEFIPFSEGPILWDDKAGVFTQASLLVKTRMSRDLEFLFYYL